MDFGLFTTWNAVYVGDKVPWDAEYRGGQLLEEAAYAQNWKEVQAVEEMGWDYIWLGGGHCRPHPTDQDWDLHPPPHTQAARG